MADLKLIEQERFPEALLKTSPRELGQIFPAPTLLHLPGRRPDPLFVSVLLHGHEVTGFEAVQKLLWRYRNRKLPRALSIFFGNIGAARLGVRSLPGQPDYNRVWPGTETPELPEARLMAQVFERVAKRRPFASIDIHNNSGRNPHYGCINRLDHRFVFLANLFSRTVVYFTRPKGVQSMAFARLCPAVTIECGLPGKRWGREHAVEFLEAALHLDHLPNRPLPPEDVDLFHTLVTVKVGEKVAFAFGEGGVELQLRPDLDRLNFTELPAGTVLGRVGGERMPLSAIAETGEEVTGDYFEIVSGELRLKRPVVPSMFTLDRAIIRQDCLGYLMERLPYPEVCG